MIVSSEGNASTISVDMLRYKLLPSCTTLNILRNTSVAFDAKLNTLTTDSFIPSARSEERHCSASPEVVYGDGCQVAGRKLM